jgi:hypothetical protein
MTRVLEGLDIPNRVALFRSEIIPNLIDRLAFILRTERGRHDLECPNPPEHESWPIRDQVPYDSYGNILVPGLDRVHHGSIS